MMPGFFALRGFSCLVLLALDCVVNAAAEKQPMIFDSDYGPFIDDVFALGLLINSDDIIDLQLIVATSEQPELSAKCMAAQLQLSEVTGIPVAIGASFPPHEERGSVCAIEGIMGFAMEPECQKYNGTSVVEDEDGVEYMANMIMDSDRDDWWYMVVGGQSSLKALIESYPEAAAKIDTVIVMAGNWCADFEPYPGVSAPTDETNIGCDPAAANYVLDGNNIQFNNVYYVPVVMADKIGGADYKVFSNAAASGSEPTAAATMTWYKIWSEAGRADESLLVHAEAMEYDPDTQSTPQFDPAAVMLALELLSDDCEERMALYEMEGIHFFESGDDGLQPFPAAPRSAFSMHTGLVDGAELPEQCPNITSFVFDPADTPEMEYPVKVALGYKSAEAKAAVYSDMARRMAGERVLCGVTSDVIVEEMEDGKEEADLESSGGHSTWGEGAGTIAAGIVSSLSFLMAL